MSDSRAEFEAFAASIGHRLVPSTNPHVDYAAPVSNHVWEFWKAARKAALEEAVSLIQRELDHAAINDLRMVPRIGKSVGDIAVPALYLEAAIDAIRSLADRSST